MLAGRIQQLVNMLPVKSGFARSLLGAMLVALIVALGTIGGLYLFNFPNAEIIGVTVATIAALHYFVST